MTVTEFWTPGETHYPTDPAFYPGEVDALWGVNNSAVESAVWAEGGTSATVASPASFIAGGGAWIYEKYDPRPDIIQGYWLVRVRGTGTLVFATGVDAASDWDWYYGAQEIAWSSAGSEDVNSVEFVDLHVPITPYVFTQANMEDGTFLLKVEVTAGSVEFDVMDFRCASSFGYHRETGNTTYSDWQDREFRVVNASAGRTRSASARIPYGTSPASLVLCGTAATPPVDDIRPQLDAAMAQLHGSTDAGPVPDGVTSIDDPAYYPTPGTYFSSTESNSAWAGCNVQMARWSWCDYYAGFPLYGWPPRDANWYWGQAGCPASETYNSIYIRTNQLIAHSIRFEQSAVTKPTINTLMNERDELVSGVHFSGGQYEAGVDSDFINWAVTTPQFLAPADIGKVGMVIGLHDFDNYHGAAVTPDEWKAWASTPLTLEARIVLDWEVGEPIPEPGTGILLASATFTPESPLVDDWILTEIETIPYEAFGLVMSIVSGHGRASSSLKMSPRVLLPRYQYAIPEWEYLGGFVSENGPPLNFVMVTNDC